MTLKEPENRLGRGLLGWDRIHKPIRMHESRKRE